MCLPLGHQAGLFPDPRYNDSVSPPGWRSSRFAAAPCRAVVPNLFGTRGQFHGRQFFHRPEWGWLFWGDSRALHILCTSFLLLIHQLHLRSSGIRSWSLGTPARPQFLTQLRSCARDPLPTHPLPGLLRIACELGWRGGREGNMLLIVPWIIKSLVYDPGASCLLPPVCETMQAHITRSRVKTSVLSRHSSGLYPVT